MRFARAAVVLVVAGLCALPHASAQPAPAAAKAEQARALLQHGLALYDTQRYAEAIEEFQRGYELSPMPAFLFAIGQARRLSGDCSGAIRAFEAFLRKAPPPSQERAAQELIAGCRDVPPLPPAPAAPRNAPAVSPGTAASNPPRSAVATDEPAAAPAPGAPSPGTEAPMAPRRKLATLVLGGAALAALVAASAFELSAAARHDELVDSCAPPRGAGCSEQQISSLSLRIDVANGLLVTSGVLAVATLVAWYVQRDRPRDPAVRVAARGVAFEF